MVNLVLHNATVITLEPSQPTASSITIEGGLIKAVGEQREMMPTAASGARLIDCGGATIVPAFHDAHCHLLALASLTLAVDCSPWLVNSIREIQAAINHRAEITSLGQWIRARGYHEAILKERRHPSRNDLDQITSHHPIKLTHQTGHASVLNSAGLVAVGIHRETPDPPGGVIDRDLATGEPTGLLLEMEDYLEERIPSLSFHELEKGLKLAGDLLLSRGVTTVQDATPNNSLERWHLWGKVQERGSLHLRLTMMPGLEHLDKFWDEGLRFGHGDLALRLGHAKGVVTLTTGDIYPSEGMLMEQTLKAGVQGFPVAFHAIEMEAVEAVVETIRQVRHYGGSSDLRHRIEHASECPHWLTQKLGEDGLLVVTQPGFIFYNGDRYLREVSKERQEWLYPLQWHLDAGVRVAGSSDAPVVPPDPLMGIYAAVTRTTAEGNRVNPQQSVSSLEGLKMYTTGAAYAGCLEKDIGSIAVGKAADLVVIDKNPLVVDAEEFRNLRVLMTILGGEVVWQA